MGLKVQTLIYWLDL